MNYQALAAEVAKLEYAELSDQEVADALNAATVVSVRNLPVAEVAAWATESGVMTGLYLVQLSQDAPIELRAIAQTLLNVLETLDEWRIADPSGQPTAAAERIIGALVQAGVMTLEQSQDLVSLAVGAVSWGEVAGIGVILPEMVQSARSGEWVDQRRWSLLASLMSDLSAKNEPIAATKAQLAEAIAAVDGWLDLALTDLMEVIPQPARDALTEKQVARILAFIATRIHEE